jgi:hypothetical protein
VIIIRVAADGMPRETLVKALSAARKGRGTAPMLTREPQGGYHYIQLDHAGVAADVEAFLSARYVESSRVDGLPGGKRLGKAAPRTTTGSQGGWRPTDDPRVREAVVAAAIRLVEQAGQSLFGTQPRRP